MSKVEVIESLLFGRDQMRSAKIKGHTFDAFPKKVYGYKT